MWALVQVLPIKRNKFLSDCYETEFVQWHSIQRSWLGDVVEIEKRPSELLLIKYKKVKVNNQSQIEKRPPRTKAQQRTKS